MYILYIISVAVLFILGAALGLAPFFVSTGKAPSAFLIAVGLLLAAAIACVWYFAPLNKAGVRPAGLLFFAILFPLVIASLTYYYSHSDQRELQNNAGPREQSYVVSVDYSQPFSSVFKRDSYGEGFSGRDFRDDITPEHFPIKGVGNVEVKVAIIKFAEPMRYQDIEKVVSERGQTVARIEHLMALHDLHPELQLFNQGSIYALGSQWIDEEGQQRVAALATENPHELRANFLGEMSLADDWFAIISEQ